MGCWHDCWGALTLISSMALSKSSMKSRMTRNTLLGSVGSYPSPKYSVTCCISAFTCCSYSCSRQNSRLGHCQSSRTHQSLHPQHILLKTRAYMPSRLHSTAVLYVSRAADAGDHFCRKARLDAMMSADRLQTAKLVHQQVTCTTKNMMFATDVHRLKKLSPVTCVMLVRNLAGVQACSFAILG